MAGQVRLALDEARLALRYLRDVDLRGAGTPLIVSAREARVLAEELVEALASVTEWLEARSKELARAGKASREVGDAAPGTPTKQEVAREMAAVFIPEFRRFLESRGTTLEQWLVDKVIPDGP